VAEAMAVLRQAQPDVLLADISMPNEDGYALMRNWRAEEHANGYRRVPAIAVTANASARDRDLATAAGFDRHVAKPIDIEELMRAIAAATRPPSGSSQPPTSP
jgi:CheY-like chemotaxis protein